MKVAITEVTLWTHFYETNKREWEPSPKLLLMGCYRNFPGSVSPGGIGSHT